MQQLLQQLPLSPGRKAPRLKLPGAGPPLLPEVWSGQENLGNPGAADPLTAPNGVAWPCEGAAAAAVVPSAVNASLKGTPDWAAAASGLDGFVAADPEPDDAERDAPEPSLKKDAAAEGAADAAVVGAMTGAAKGAAGVKPAEGAAAASAAEAGAVLLLSALGALEAELNVHPLVPKGVAADCLP